jgi:hypothetical protein
MTNMAEKLHFAKSLTPSEKEDISRRTSGIPNISEELQEGVRIVEKSPEDVATLQGWLDIAASKLALLGFEDPLDVLPSTDSIIITEREPTGDPLEEAGGGAVGRDSEGVKYLRLHKWAGSQLSSRDNEKIFYHEASHFLARSSVRRSLYDEEDHYLFDDGFGRGGDVMAPSSVGGNMNRGIWEEGPADIFAAFCAEDQISTVYPGRVALYIALTKDLSEKLSIRDGEEISEIETFALLLRSHTQRDFSFQRVLRDIYGTDFVKKINNIHIDYGSTVERDDILSVVSLGGLSAGFMQELNALTTSSGAALEGLDGYVVVDDSMNTPETARLNEYKEALLQHA